MWNKDYARKFVIKMLRKKGYKEIRMPYINKFGHTFIRTNHKNFYFIFKKDHLYSFKYLFPEYSKSMLSLRGFGESINKEYLIFCLRNDAELLFCFRDYNYKVYVLDRKKIKKIMLTLNPEADYTDISTTNMLFQYCNIFGLIRDQDKENVYKTNDYSGNAIIIREKTYSFPFALLREY